MTDMDCHQIKSNRKKRFFDGVGAKRIDVNLSIIERTVWEFNFMPQIQRLCRSGKTTNDRTSENEKETTLFALYYSSDLNAALISGTYVQCNFYW